MNKKRRLSLFAHLLLLGLFTFLTLAAPTSNAAPTIWNGPTITFTHSTATGNLQDQLTSGVSLTRSSGGGGLYNAVTESGAISGTSPKDTAWAIGALTNYNELTYGSCPLEAGNHPPGYVNTTFVVHLINEDIYFSLKLTAWGGQGGSGDKSFTYIRSTPAVVAPTVTITNPAAGAIFAAPASLKLGANAAAGGGTVTNMEFFANTTALGSVTAAPFNLTSTSLNAGAYSLTAVATASGISATSPPVNITVVNPATVSLSATSVDSDQFSFSYIADIGLTYVVQSSSNLVDWVSLATNTATVNPVPFSDPLSANGIKFYRVGRLPNP